MLACWIRGSWEVHIHCDMPVDALPKHKQVFGASSLCSLCWCGGFAELMSNTAMVDNDA
jgi:hypothetical protein